MDLILLFLGGVALFGAGLGLGYKFGRGWVLLFLLVMAVAFGLLVLSLFSATGAQAGMAELLAFFFIWLPVFFVMGTGSGFGWWWRALKSRPE